MSIDQRLIGQVAFAEAKLAIDWLLRTKKTPGLHSQLAQELDQFGFRNRLDRPLSLS